MTKPTTDGSTRDEGASTIEPLTDPETLRGREDVEFREKASVEHQHHFDLYGPIDGMAVVGTTNDTGEVLLLVNRNAGQAMLPYGRVEFGADYATVGQQSIEELTGVAVGINGVTRVRRKRYRPEDGGTESAPGSGDRETTGYDVVFRASPVGDRAVMDDSDIGDRNDDWEVGWFDAVPVDTDTVNGAVVADVRLFLD